MDLGFNVQNQTDTKIKWLKLNFFFKIIIAEIDMKKILEHPRGEHGRLQAPVQERSKFDYMHIQQLRLHSPAGAPQSSTIRSSSHQRTGASEREPLEFKKGKPPQT